jgi:hypothetical protein
MPEPASIDISFDFGTDTPPGRDPDLFSPTLRRYHRLLWSKPLPDGLVFELDDSAPLSTAYLHHLSVLGEFFLASDTVIPSFWKEPAIAAIVDQTSRPDHETFHRLSYTIGGMMLFPGNRVGGKMTVNGARGFHPRIKDRFDLTVECIRRHYVGERSPLSEVLARYAGFFALFRDFTGYVAFFHLQDLVDAEVAGVRFFTPFDGFEVSPVPASREGYLAYRDCATAFIRARNRRIAAAVDAGAVGRPVVSGDVSPGWAT